MKIPHKILPGILLIVGGLGALSSCATDGYVAASTGVYYGGPAYSDPWFHEEPWVYGHPWHREPPDTHVGVYIHPPRTGHPHPEPHPDPHHR